MNIYYAIGLGLGVFVANLIARKFLFKDSWRDAIGIGSIAGILSFIMMSLIIVLSKHI